MAGSDAGRLAATRRVDHRAANLGKSRHFGKPSASYSTKSAMGRASLVLNLS